MLRIKASRLNKAPPPDPSFKEGSTWRPRREQEDSSASPAGSAPSSPRLYPPTPRRDEGRAPRAPRGGVSGARPARRIDEHPAEPRSLRRDVRQEGGRPQLPDRGNAGLADRRPPVRHRGGRGGTSTRRRGGRELRRRDELRAGARSRAAAVATAHSRDPRQAHEGRAWPASRSGRVPADAELDRLQL